MSPGVGKNDQIDRVYLQKYDGTVQGAVTLFVAANCDGYSGRFEAPTDPAGENKYNLQALGDRHIGNDRVSSIMIPKGYSVTLCKADGFVDCDLTLHGADWDPLDTTE